MALTTYDKHRFCGGDDRTATCGQAQQAAIGTVGAVIVKPAYARIPVAVAYSGISRSGLYRLIAEGAVEARKIGGATIVSVASIDAYLGTLPFAARAINE